jgi:hypothetical protein
VKTNPIIKLILKGIKGLTIEGNGSEFICHGRMQPLTLFALSVDGLTFKDNTIKHNTQYKL